MKTHTIQEYVDGILRGDRIILAKAITLIESTRAEDIKAGQEVLEKCLPHAGKSIRMGITGVPGVGKSTFIEALGNHILDKGRMLAVLAIDPSSERTKGSILGDKTRMEKLSQQPNAFIRPSPATGTLGGVANNTREAITLCEAAGYDTIFIETVGVGQSEIAVHAMVDFFMLLLLPGAGDQLQGMKRGIVEMADLIAINKADGDNLKKAKLAQAEYSQALHLFPPTEKKWKPQVVTCSSISSEGIEDIWKIVLEYEAKMKSSGYFEQNRNEQNKRWLYEMIQKLVLNNFHHHEKIKSLLLQLEEQVANGEISVQKAANELLSHALIV